MPTVPKSAVDEQYQLRSSFFTNNLSTLGFLTLSDDVISLSESHKESLTWKDRYSWGISKESWEIIHASSLNPCLFFIHPNLIRISPKLLKYYRCIALIPQKGLLRLTGFDSKSAEEIDRRLTPAKLIEVTTSINKFMSFLIHLEGVVSEKQLNAAMFATAGVMIDGSWRNQIGVEGERVIRSLLIKELEKKNDIAEIKDINNITIFSFDPTKKVSIDDLKNISSRARSIFLKNGCIILFKSEPDIEILSSDGTILGGIEIKAGLDPAAALERLGAMLKSFDNILSVSPTAHTILVASCLTTEVESRIRASSTVKSTYILTEITNSPKTCLKFVNKIRSVVGLVAKTL
jgi:hypothetical protein